MKLFDKSANELYERGPEVIATVEQQDAVPGWNPGNERIRLEEITTPKERIIILLKSYFDIRQHDSTDQANLAREATLGAFVLGMGYGAFIKSNDVREQFIRTHNASIFNHKYTANFKYIDTMILNITSRSFKYGFRAGASVGLLTLLYEGSIAIRSELYAPDWILGTAIFGGLTRLWLGPRAVAFGSLMGSAVGSLFFGLNWLAYRMNPLSVSEINNLRYQEWVKKRDAKLIRKQLHSEKMILERYKELE